MDRPPRRGCPCLAAVADLCAKPLAASGWPSVLVARIQGLCGGFDCISARGRPLLPAPAFRRFQLRPSPQVSGCLCRWRGWGRLRWVVGGPHGTAGRGATGVLWATLPTEGNQGEIVSVRALALWLSGRHRIDWGGVVTRMQGNCPLGKVHG